MFLPNKVSPFIFRNRDMFDVLQSILQSNIVQIFGLPGFGKSSLLKNVTCFLGERDIYKSGVLYIDFIHVETFREALQIIHTYLR
jgi:ABC-type transport system involved in cytochrome c biogenesis ATPase subunit